MTPKSTFQLNLKLRKAKAEDFYRIDEDGRKKYLWGISYWVFIDEGKYRVDFLGKHPARQRQFSALFEAGRVFMVENTDGVGGIIDCAA